VATVLTPADFVWNRAMSDEPATGTGDRHLHTVTVHELGNTCSLDADCARLSDGFIQHEWVKLHDSAECERCPSGRDWAH